MSAKLFTNLGGLFIIAAALAAGEIIKSLAALPTPAPVLGILILVGVQFILPDFLRQGLHRVADFLLRHMALFFIPALMVLLEQGALLKEYGLAILVIIICGTAITLPLMAYLFMRLAPQNKETQL